MTDKEKHVPLEDAIEQVEAAVRRIALIHLGFSKTLELLLVKPFNLSPLCSRRARAQDSK